MRRLVALGAALLVIGTAIALLAGGWTWIKARFYLDHMERQDRLERALQAERVVRTLELVPGGWSSDIGAGSGIFTRRSRSRSLRCRLCRGHQPESLTHIEKTAEDAGSPTSDLARDRGRPRLPAALGLVFICDTLHYIEEPEPYLRKLHAHVRPGGRVAIIDFFRNWPPMSNQFSAERLEGWMKLAGFALVEKHDFLPDEYFLIFQRG
jgi:SAM-dependent methyltransferase